jgi:hypothetical protein
MKCGEWLPMRWRCYLVLAALGVLHCSSPDGGGATTGRGSTSTGTGGATSGTGASSGSAGTTGSGGAGGNATGGSGGTTTTGGTGATGGQGGAGGSSGTGATGGGGGSGGSAGSTGGTTGTGGASGAGGSGGSSGTGTGGSAGTAGKGGSGTGGGAGTGGTVGTGGSAGTSGDGGVTPDAAPPIACGDAGGGPGAPFPPLTSYTATDGGFGSVVARNVSDATSGPVAIFRPSQYGQGGVRHPIVVWGNGRTNTVDIWARFLQRVASYGFVVVAPEQDMVTTAHMNAGIDYVLRLAADPNGTDCGKIDTTKLAATGYSMGGGGAIGVAAGARITATFLFAALGINNTKNIKAPWAGTFAENDEFFAWSTIKPATLASPQPAFAAMITGTTHNNLPGNAKSSEAYIGFLRWRFMGDPAGKEMFVGASCKICTDTAFGEVVKTSTWDSL